MSAVDASATNFASGPEQVNGRKYQQTLYDIQNEGTCGYSSPDSTTYQLNRKYRTFRATVGLADTTLSGDTMTFSVLADGQQKGMAQTIGVGQTETIKLNVAGVFRITLQDACSTQNNGTTDITAVWINPAVKP